MSGVKSKVYFIANVFLVKIRNIKQLNRENHQT